MTPRPAPFEPGYPRDLAGYGEDPPHARWPGGARIAVQFVLNYEEGAENCVLHGDPASETFLSEIVNAQPFPQRHLSLESLYEYGSRAGVWRILRLFRQHRLPLTVFGVGMALARNPAVVAAFLADGHEIASHGACSGSDPRAHRPPARRLVHRPRQPEHAPPAGRARRIHL
jgi:allantoinase